MRRLVPSRSGLTGVGLKEGDMVSRVTGETVEGDDAGIRGRSLRLDPKTEDCHLP